MGEGQPRDFKGVWVPREVWLDSRLTALDKFILIEIDSLDGEGGCYASNEYIAKFCQCSQTKVSTAISKLVKIGYIEPPSFDGRRRVIRSNLSKSERLPFKICKAPFQNLKEIVLEDSTNKEEELTSGKPDPVPYEDVVDFLNEQTGKHFRAGTEKTRALIRARWSEGFRLDDFKTVIRNMTSRWKGDPKMDDYLRPQTLFGTKFEAYLNLSPSGGSQGTLSDIDWSMYQLEEI